jgi:hypothetical protein
MAGRVFLMVTRGDGSRLCHGDDVSAKGFEEARWGGGFRSFFEVWWSCSNNRRGIGVAGCRGPWDKMMEPDWFAMSTPPRTSGFSCSWAKPPLLTRVCCRNTVGTPTKPPAGSPCLVASPARRFCSAPAPTAPNLHARG